MYLSDTYTISSYDFTAKPRRRDPKLVSNVTAQFPSCAWLIKVDECSPKYSGESLFAARYCEKCRPKYGILHLLHMYKYIIHMSKFIIVENAKFY